MKSYYSAVDSLSKKAGGPYCFSSILIKRVRQLVKGSFGGFRSEGFDPVNIAFEEYGQDKLQVLQGGVPLELVQRKEKKKGKK